MTAAAPFGKLRLWSSRARAAAFLGGQVLVHMVLGKIHRRNTLEQMRIVGPDSLGIIVLAGISIGSVFTIQVAREFIKYGASSAIGGILAVAMARELAPVFAAVILAGRVGSAFAAEIGTMRVTEQIDALYMLKTDPVDYLVVPRAIACALMLPLLTLLGFIAGTGAGLLVAAAGFGISSYAFLNSVRMFLDAWDLLAALVKGLCFGVLIAVIGCSWGLTTSGGAKGVGESTTTAVVTSLLAILIANFFLSWLMFQGGITA
ncbi:MAG: MlaE family lipid ABC transporter permease subunit [Cyanobacteria bacterium]|nr:MlaE family lipid ABC transporter permease subunit [Cyanobacteriota bacterium]